MHSCLCVCVCVYVSTKRLLINASSRVAKEFTDVAVNENNQHNHTRTFLYLIQVRAVLYAVISAIIGFVAPPLLKLHGVVMVSNETHTPIHENTGGIDLAMYKEARGEVFHEYTVVRLVNQVVAAVTTGMLSACRKVTLLWCTYIVQVCYALPVKQTVSTLCLLYKLFPSFSASPLTVQ